MRASHIFTYIIFLLALAFAPAWPALAVSDRDGDGLSDQDEISIYYTLPDLVDTDGDGYGDGEELASGYSPHRPEYRLSQLDWDKDGLSDEAELFFGSDLRLADTDDDGYGDYSEVDAGYSPVSSAADAKLEKSLEIDLHNQKLHYLVGGYRWKSFLVSTGKPSMPTPTGEYQIVNKSPKAWSSAYGLWMPYWLGLGTGRFGIHELPIWPSGYREGEDHLGKAVSHGCIRLGVGPAVYVYSRLSVGDRVVIH